MFHVHVQYRSRDGGSSCESARQYIAREGKYKLRGDKVRWVRSVHMPSWAGAGSAPTYWRAAEGDDSRENARTAILIEGAIPKTLNPEQQEELVLELIELIASRCSKDGRVVGKLPLTVALHEGYGRNPHIHILLSTSIADGHMRNADQWFHRYNPKNPSGGGARRSEFVTKRGWLFAVRSAWARLANAALVRFGQQPTLDHRSHAERGLAIEPQIHLGPTVAHMMRQGYATVRTQKFDEIERRKEEDRELADAIERRRKHVDTLKHDLFVLDHAESEFNMHCERELRNLLKEHPLSSGFETPLAATALVTDVGTRSLAHLDGALDSGRNFERFGSEVGLAWIPVRSGGAFWAVRPGRDSVVMLGRNHAATDAEDAESIEAMIRSASLMALVAPTLFVQSQLKQLSVDLLTRLGLEWPIEVLMPQMQRRPLRL